MSDPRTSGGTGSASALAPEDERAEPTSSDSIVSARDLRIKVKFFCGILASMAIDVGYLLILLAILAFVHWLFNYIKTWFPAQVSFVKVGEWVGLIGVSVCCMWFIVLDVRNTLIRTSEVMTKRGESSP
jgi:hypothetical protein